MIITPGIPAIISGGASGMGAATAVWLAQQGAKVSILDSNYHLAEELAATISGAAFACDVSNAEQVETAVAQAQQRYGAARICVNCAGIAPAQKIVGKEGAMPLAQFNRVIEINLIGTFNLLRVVANEMSQLGPIGNDGERGVIINTASIAAYEGQIGQAAYSASKGGIVALTLPAARELARYGIRVNTIAPGLIATPLLLNMPQDVQNSLAATVPFPKRFGRPEEFAKLVGHIVENSMLNGEVIRLDGGLRMQPK